MGVQVLLIEDDETIAEPPAEGLRNYGFSVSRNRVLRPELELGADDCPAKPFSLRELVARIPERPRDPGPGQGAGAAREVAFL